MFGADTTNSITDELQTKIQGYVGEFLSDRQRLQAAMASPDSAIASQAKSLMQTQAQLEIQLPDVMSTINSAKAGDFSLTGLATAGGFVGQMALHLNNVNNLLGKPKAGGVGVSKMNFALALTVIGIGLVWMRGRKR